MTKANKARLHELLLNYDRKLHPTLPDHCRVIEIFEDTNEKGIKKNLKAFCDINNLKWLETDSKAIRSTKVEMLEHATGNQRKHVTTHYRKSNLESGHHDCEIGKNGFTFCIEIKAHNIKTKYKDKQSKVQKDFEMKLKDQFGFDYYIIRGMDDFFILYDEVILPKVSNLFA